MAKSNSRTERRSLLRSGGSYRILLIIGVAAVWVVQPGAGGPADVETYARSSEASSGRIAYVGEDPNMYVSDVDGSCSARSDGHSHGPGIGKIAFQRSTFGNEEFEIHVLTLDRDEESQLTNNTAVDADPAWSPDGSQIAFGSDRHGGNLDIYVMSADGSDARRLTQKAMHDNGPSWSPDGREIAFFGLSDPANYEIFAVAIDGTGLRNLSKNDASDEGPAWSPDGSRIAFSSNRDGNFEIYVMNRDGSDQTRLTNSVEDDLSPSWSPLGDAIAFSRGGQIWVMCLDDQSEWKVASGHSPAWSPDGTRLAFAAFDLDGNGYDIYTISPAGTDLQRLTATPWHEGNPAWQPLPKPTMLVHGLGSSADAWGTESDRGLLQYLQSIFGDENVLAFDYGDEAPGTPCRAQGDIEAYARKLADDVGALLTSAREETGRDDLKVDFVVHSMGGLIVRRYLQTDEGKSSTGKVTFLHTPHQGSYLESVQALKDKPVLDLVLKGLSATVGEAMGLDFSCPAHDQMEPGSDFLTRLNATGLPEGIEYDSFFSNIRVSPYTSIWGVELQLVPFNAGDTAVTLADARLPGDCVKPDGFLSLLLADPEEVQFSCPDGSTSGADLHTAFAEARVGLPDLGLCVLAGELCSLLAIETAPDIQAVLDLPQSHSGVMEGIVEPGHSYRVLPDGGDAQLLDAILRPRALARR